MELQLDHVDAEGHRAIISILIESKGQNGTLRGVWNAMRRLKSKPWTIEGVMFNPSDILPTVLNYYAYTGSLTTPACTEGVQWIVLQNPISLSANQITQFDNLFPASARPLEPLNDRDVSAYSSTASTPQSTENP